MAIEVQCPCGKRVGVPDQFAGKTVRCPACKQPLVVPAANTDPPADDVDEDLMAMVRRAAPVPPPRATPPQSGPAPAATPAPGSMPPEPWYYGFLSGLAVLAAVVGVLACLLVMLVGYSHATAGGTGDFGSGPREAFGVYLMATGGLSLIGVLMVSAAALLVVDVARNVRATRYK